MEYLLAAGAGAFVLLIGVLVGYAIAVQAVKERNTR